MTEVTDCGAEEALRGLARDLVEELVASRTVELSRGPERDEAPEAPGKALLALPDRAGVPYCDYCGRTAPPHGFEPGLTSGGLTRACSDQDTDSCLEVRAQRLPYWREGIPVPEPAAGRGAAEPPPPSPQLAPDPRWAHTLANPANRSHLISGRVQL